MTKKEVSLAVLQRTTNTIKKKMQRIADLRSFSVFFIILFFVDEISHGWMWWVGLIGSCQLALQANDS